MLAITRKTKAIKMLPVVGICAMLFSFSSPWGGEGFQIFLNNKVVLQQFGNDMNSVKTLNLHQASPNDEISVRYHHCGKIGKNRIITIKDEQDKVLKQWKFSNSSEVLDPMTCKVKDILGLKNGKSSTLKLYYSSSELVKERQLASISVGAKSIASL
jgi:hypothetical protein